MEVIIGKVEEEEEQEEEGKTILSGLVWVIIWRGFKKRVWFDGFVYWIRGGDFIYFPFLR